MIDLDALETAAREAQQMYENDPLASWETWRMYMRKVHPPTVLALIARLRAAEGALKAIHEFCNDDGNWEHEEIIADDGMFVGCDGRYTVEAMASDALKGLADAVPNV